MVAFELARLYEKMGSSAEAAQWYLTASEKFRRAQWKTKAQEALTRLGVDVPLAATEAAAQASERPRGQSHDIDKAGDSIAVSEAALEANEATGEPEVDADTGMPAPDESSGAGTVAAAGVIQGAAGPVVKKGRRRGRRGGRGRHKRQAAGAPAVPSVASQSASTPASPESPSAQPVSGRQAGHHGSRGGQRQQSISRRGGRVSETDESRLRRTPAVRAEQESETRGAGQDEPTGMVGPAAWQGRRRAGEPALASRLAMLESQLRRMLAAPAVALDDAERAPAGPGVFVLSDSELIDHYYVEACQTLRIGIGNLVRSGKSRGGENIKVRLAEHLGITEARVTKYMKDHCSIRWVQVDDQAPLLAHFAVAVLKPALNE